MKNLLRKICPIIFVLTSPNLSAQTININFTAVDNYIKSIGPLDSMSMGTINNIVTSKFINKIDKVRAIYDWIARNITYDVKAARANNISKNSPTEVLLHRKAVGIGFASLFQDMCSNANIRCLTVDGFIKNNVDEIGEKGNDINHSWAVVQLGESPDSWFYVDPAFGSGYTDVEMKTFTKSFTDAYFFTDKETFNLQHYPDNTAWKLGPSPKSKKDFFNLPVVKPEAVELGLKKISPEEGFLKVKANRPIKFTFTLGNDDAKITKVEVGTGSRKRYNTKEIAFSFTNGQLNFTYIFEEEDSFPLTILVNGKQFVLYQVDIN
ncbi:MAG TPA: transglutaminase domain-containing protein [Ferruginibacter sp.]|nr:transglutaminase domain-containing protein [Ferruginibacter sp.]